jgi:hypothetical protein
MYPIVPRYDNNFRNLDLDQTCFKKMFLLSTATFSHSFMRRSSQRRDDRHDSGCGSWGGLTVSLPRLTRSIEGSQLAALDGL